MKSAFPRQTTPPSTRAPGPAHFWPISISWRPFSSPFSSRPFQFYFSWPFSSGRPFISWPFGCLALGIRRTSDGADIGGAGRTYTNTPLTSHLSLNKRGVVASVPLYSSPLLNLAHVTFWARGGRGARVAA